MKQHAQALIAHAKVHRSKIIVPAFAVGRTQELVMRLKELVTEATEAFRQHPECYDEDTYRTFASEGDPFASRYIRYVSPPQESKRLNAIKGPCVIISSSGMCEGGGRVTHHLKHAIQDKANIIVFVGFQPSIRSDANSSKGGMWSPFSGSPHREAQIVKLSGRSAHADRHDLLGYTIISPPGKVFAVHGGEKQALSLGAAIQAEHPNMEVPIHYQGSTYDV